MAPPPLWKRLRGVGAAALLVSQLGLTIASNSCAERERAPNHPPSPDCSSFEDDSSTLLQTKIPEKPDVTSPARWHPRIHEYISFLETQEATRVVQTNLETTQPSNGSTLFVLISDSNDYNTRLKWIGDTWGKDLIPSSIVAIGDAQKMDSSTKLPVQSTRCPAHTHDGACCKEAEAVIAAYEMLQKDPKFSWAYVVDDDAYVRPEQLEDRLKWITPKGPDNKGMLVGLQGCSTPACPNGLCGGGGHALSREALTSLIDGSPAKYLKQHMTTCDLCGMYGDVTVGTMVAKAGVDVSVLDGLNGWFMDSPTFHSVLHRAYEPIMFHYMKTEGQFRFLHGLFNDKSEMKAVNGPHCATYKNHTECTSEFSAVPWSEPPTA